MTIRTLSFSLMLLLGSTSSIAGRWQLPLEERTDFQSDSQIRIDFFDHPEAVVPLASDIWQAGEWQLQEDKLQISDLPVQLPDAALWAEVSIDGKSRLRRVQIQAVGGPGITFANGNDLNMDNNAITNLASPSNAADAANKGYVDAQISASGDITAVNTDNSLIGGAASGDVTLSVNTNRIQSRVSGFCPPGFYIRAIAADGFVSCEVDDNTVGWGFSGNTITAGQFLGTTNSEPLIFKVKGRQVARFEHVINPIGKHTPNVLLGSENNEIAANVYGATVGGGGGSTIALDCGDGSQVCVNRASDDYATVSGGDGNTASNVGATVSGGFHNTASGRYATVLGGYRNQVGGPYSLAAGKYAVVRDATATGFSSGDQGTFVWSDSTATPTNKFTSTGSNQFRVRSTGGSYFDIGAKRFDVRGEKTGSSAILRVENDTTNSLSTVLELRMATSDPGYGNRFIYFLKGTPGSISSSIMGAITGDGNRGLRLFSPSNLLLDPTGNVGIGSAAPNNKLHVTGIHDTSAVARIQNDSTATASDALHLVLNRQNPGSLNDFIIFWGRDGAGNLSAVGAVEGDGSGGVTYKSGSADFAEYLPTELVDLQPGEVVALRQGKLWRDTAGAERLFVVSSAPLIVGNSDMADDRGKALVAFSGQVPVKVQGDVQPGDWLLASGEHDGRARAVKQEDLHGEDFHNIIGRAIADADKGQVRVLVGLPPLALLRLQQQQYQSLEKDYQALKMRLGLLEQKQAVLRSLEARLSRLESENVLSAPGRQVAYRKQK